MANETATGLDSTESWPWRRHLAIVVAKEGLAYLLDR
jgi:hypothetical protein